MTGATDPDGISFAELGDAIDPVAESATQASSIQNALNNRALHTHRWPTITERNAEANMQEGDQGYQQDTDAPYLYAGLNLGWMPVSYGVGRMLAGSVLVPATGTAPNFTGSVNVSFPPGYFTATPYVITGAFSSKPGNVNTTANLPTTAGFSMMLHRTDSATSTTCFWIAAQAN